MGTKTRETVNTSTAILGIFKQEALFVDGCLVSLWQNLPSHQKIDSAVIEI